MPTCIPCKGTGRIEKATRMGTTSHTCFSCSGTGVVDSDRIPRIKPEPGPGQCKFEGNPCGGECNGKGWYLYDGVTIYCDG